MSRSTVTSIPPATLGPARDIALGDRHTCALLMDGSVWCWGANESGQLGNNTTTARPTPIPTKVEDLIDITAIAAGGAFTCAVHQSGDVVCWGRNVDGELGLGLGNSTDPVLTPPAISSPVLSNVQALIARDRHACALTTDGLVFCWGSNEQGELGDGTQISKREPTPIRDLTGITAIAAGAAHTCSLGAGGQLWCWGANQLGELGDGTDETHVLPTRVAALSSVSTIVAAGHHTCASQNDGTVWCWGANQAGQLGEGTTGNIGVPVPVTGIEDAADLAAGTTFSCARRHDGTVWCWGDDRLGQLGTGVTIERLRPEPVVGLTGALSVTAGGAHTCARRSTSATGATGSSGPADTVCWGDNQAGQIGDGTRLDRPIPVPLKIPLPAQEVVAGSLHTCLRRDDNSVWCWGRGGAGQLGMSTLIDVVIPASVAGLGDSKGIGAGKAHTCALQNTTVLCWGANDEGQLGDGTNSGRSMPAAVVGAGDVREVALGGAHTCVRRGDGTVACWGRGSEGQLGHGDLNGSATPVVVAKLAGTDGTDLANVVGLAAGSRHTCALLGDGRVACWGEGSAGQLGWGAKSRHEIPVEVKNLPDRAVEIAAGDNHTCARTSTEGLADAPASVLCWGDNEAGQLGDGRMRPFETTPVQTLSLADAVAIAAGGAHTCAVRTDRSVTCWGSDSAGQLGDGSILQYLTAQPTHIICP